MNELTCIHTSQALALALAPSSATRSVSEKALALIDTYTRARNRSVALFGSRRMRPAISICRRARVRARAIHARRERAGKSARTRGNTYTRYRSVVARGSPRSLLGSPAPDRPFRPWSMRRMRYNLDIPYIHVQDMPPILNIPSCNS